MNSARRTEVEGRLPGYLWLWFGAIGGQVAWALAVLFAYPTVQIACATGIPALVHAVRWVAMVVALAATAAGYLAWRRVEGLAGDRHDQDLATARHLQRARFMGFGGMLLSSFGFFLLFVEDIATWVIDPCL